MPTLINVSPVLQTVPGVGAAEAGKPLDNVPERVARDLERTDAWQPGPQAGPAPRPQSDPEPVTAEMEEDHDA